MSKKKIKKPYGENTNLVHAGRNPEEYFGVVNPPVVRTSTILYPSLEAYENPDHKFRYAPYGTPLTDKFTTAMAELEGGFAGIATPCGLSAVTTTLLAVLKAGDHLLVSDVLYPPAHDFCSEYLTRFGVEVEFYNPLIGKGIEKLIRKNTKLIYMESPGSATFEVMDVPAIVVVAKKKNITTMLDNSWSGGMLYKPLAQGVNVAVQSATKYVGGHSDLTLGVIVTDSEKNFKIIKTTAKALGVCPGSEELYLALRGLRTMKLRLRQHAENALKVAKWLEKRKEIQRVYHPALPGDPGHKIWKRDFAGANGLLSILLQPSSKAAVRSFVDSLTLFPIGSSWGGYESLLQPQYLKSMRVALPWTEKGMLLRLHVGLEDPEDLIADLEQALDKFRAAS